jgi:hypothetical protein
MEGTTSTWIAYNLPWGDHEWPCGRHGGVEGHSIALKEWTEFRVGGQPGCKPITDNSAHSALKRVQEAASSVVRRACPRRAPQTQLPVLPGVVSLDVAALL